MSSFDGQGAPLRTILIIGRSGTHKIVSLDSSPFRIGSHSLLTTGNLWTAGGNQPPMYVLTHNFDVDGFGNYMGRDETDGCSMMCWYEDNQVRYFGAPSAAKGTIPVLTQTFGIDILTPYGTAARAGCAGELITATIGTPGTTLTTATPANVITTPFLSLTAGDWDVWGTCCFLPAATTSITQIACGISATSATLPAAGAGLLQETHAALVPTAIPQCFGVPEVQVKINATTPYYLVAQAAFTLAALTAFGTLYARRRR